MTELEKAKFPIYLKDRYGDIIKVIDKETVVILKRYLSEPGRPICYIYKYEYRENASSIVVGLLISNAKQITKEEYNSRLEKIKSFINNLKTD
jgi:hypothetical protein